ncbi:MAG TPA: DUF998 domain-containing protein, partial [Micromonosporaceae bacterium]|nr:DUF998 domain-containing protein [Micromonosporaceae bacterium]
MISRRNLALLSLGGVFLTALLALIGQIDPNPELDPFQLTVSDYAVMDRGGATDTAMVLFGGSALALMLALRSRVALPLLLFSVAMIVAAIAPTDFGTELSTVGYIHRYASMAAFIALPLAAWRIRDLPLARTIRLSAATSGVFMVLMLISSTIGDRLLIGLVERLLLLCELAVLGLRSEEHQSEIQS